MKILFASDLHGSASAAEKGLERLEKEGADRFFLLGDLLYHGPRNDLPDRYEPREVIRLLNESPIVPLCVRGNCDAYSRSDAEENLLFNADGVRIFMTHGHRYNVKLGYESLANAAHFSGAQLALFGHTHEADFLRMGDVTLFNPGSAGMGRQTYGMITVKGTEFKCEILSL